MTRPLSVWVVLPVYNERANLEHVLERFSRTDFATLVVDDGSTDGSDRVARELATWVARHSINLGQGAALQTGITLALQHGADIIVTFDSDGQHEINDVSALVSALADNAVDFALGSRFLGEAPGIPWTRRLVLKAGVAFTRIFSGIKVTDTHNGLRAMTRRGAQALDLTLNRMEHASQLLDQIVASGLSFVEVPVRIRYSEDSLAKGQRSSAAVRIAAKLMAERLT